MITDDIYCPDCKPVTNKKGRRLDKPLELIESNYSGTGEDVFSCPTCLHCFWVSYKVDEITRNQDWEDAEEVAKLDASRAAGRCPVCGYTKEDAAKWGDHHLCKGRIPE